MLEMINFRKQFFEDIFKSELGYLPSIMLAPAHLANGLFRDLCGGRYDNKIQHRAIALKLVLETGADVPHPDPKTRKEIRENDQWRAMGFLRKNPSLRQVIGEALNADRRAFTTVNQSSYSLSHWQHTTSDNHDRSVGSWLTAILHSDSEKSAFGLLRKLLMQSAVREAGKMPMTDALSLMTLPLMEEQAEVLPTLNIVTPNSVTQTVEGVFDDSIVQTIRDAFDQLALHDEASAKRNGKLDTLRRMVSLGCFCFYVHLINIGRLQQDTRMPMLLYLDRSTTTIKRASQACYGRIRHSLDAFLQQHIATQVDALIGDKLTNAADPDAVVKTFIDQEIDWYRYSFGNDKEKKKVAGFQEDCWHFYQSYRGDAASSEPVDALARALTDMVDLVFSATGFDVARNLGVKIGLLTRSDGHERKAYELHTDLLEVLVRATVPVGEQLTIAQLAEKWWAHFGILFGGLGKENELLNVWGITSVDTSELARNRRALVEQLELSGYAKSYADGVVLVRVEG